LSRLLKLDLQPELEFTRAVELARHLTELLRSEGAGRRRELRSVGHIERLKAELGSDLMIADGTSEILDDHGVQIARVVRADIGQPANGIERECRRYDECTRIKPTGDGGIVDMAASAGAGCSG